MDVISENVCCSGLGKIFLLIIVTSSSFYVFFFLPFCSSESDTFISLTKLNKDITRILSMQLVPWKFYFCSHWDMFYFMCLERELAVTPHWNVCPKRLKKEWISQSPIDLPLIEISPRTQEVSCPKANGIVPGNDIWPNLSSFKNAEIQFNLGLI